MNRYSKDGSQGGDTNLYGYVVQDPINLFDVSGFAPGDQFSTPMAAANNAGNFYRPITAATGAEFAGWIYQTPGGTYSYTPANMGVPYSGVSSPGTRPGSSNVPSGVYHTHPEGLPYSNSLSPMDGAFSITNGFPVYVTTPNGSTLTGGAGGGSCMISPLGPDMEY